MGAEPVGELAGGRDGSSGPPVAGRSKRGWRAVTAGARDDDRVHQMRPHRRDGKGRRG